MGTGQLSGPGRGACRGPAITGGNRGGAGGSGRVRGFGSGAGGRGWRDWFHATGVPGWLSGPWGGAVVVDDGESPSAIDAQTLELRSAALESELQSIKQMLNELGDFPSTTDWEASARDRAL